MKSNIAAKLFLDIQSGDDLGIALLNIIKETKDTDIDKVIEEYKSLVNGRYKVAKIITSRELETNQKDAVQNKVSALFEKLDLLFVFVVDELVEGGIQIQVGDDKINF